MKRDAKLMRGAGPVVFAQVKHDIGVDEILSLIDIAYQGACGGPDPRVPLKK
jgi:Ni2+-binding GTPase involved in maturation of urease and hydrogenase